MAKVTFLKDICPNLQLSTTDAALKECDISALVDIKMTATHLESLYKKSPEKLKLFVQNAATIKFFHENKIGFPNLTRSECSAELLEMIIKYRDNTLALRDAKLSIKMLSTFSVEEQEFLLSSTNDLLPVVPVIVQHRDAIRKFAECGITLIDIVGLFYGAKYVGSPYVRNQQAGQEILLYLLHNTDDAIATLKQQSLEAFCAATSRDTLFPYAAHVQNFICDHSRMLLTLPPSKVTLTDINGLYTGKTTLVESAHYGMRVLLHLSLHPEAAVDYLADHTLAEFCAMPSLIRTQLLRNTPLHKAGILPTNITDETTIKALHYYYQQWKADAYTNTSFSHQDALALIQTDPEFILMLAASDLTFLEIQELLKGPVPKHDLQHLLHDTLPLPNDATPDTGHGQDILRLMGRYHPRFAEEYKDKLAELYQKSTDDIVLEFCKPAFAKVVQDESLKEKVDAWQQAGCTIEDLVLAGEEHSVSFIGAQKMKQLLSLAALDPRSYHLLTPEIKKICLHYLDTTTSLVAEKIVSIEEIAVAGKRDAEQLRTVFENHQTALNLLKSGMDFGYMCAHLSPIMLLLTRSNNKISITNLIDLYQQPAEKDGSPTGKERLTILLEDAEGVITLSLMGLDFKDDICAPKSGLKTMRSAISIGNYDFGDAPLPEQTLASPRRRLARPQPQQDAQDQTWAALVSGEAPQSSNPRFSRRPLNEGSER